MSTRSFVFALVLVTSAAACTQKAAPPADEGLGIARLKSYEARRSSSDNRYVYAQEALLKIQGKPVPTWW
jgi:hypothetical protein